VGDHILSRRARFWLNAIDVVRVLRLPWKIQLWVIGRAGVALNDAIMAENPEHERMPL
jgi:hypothetical protein